MDRQTDRWTDRRTDGHWGEETKEYREIGPKIQVDIGTCEQMNKEKEGWSDRGRER
jgi:hypothetical protein